MKFKIFGFQVDVENLLHEAGKGILMLGGALGIFNSDAVAKTVNTALENVHNLSLTALIVAVAKMIIDSTTPTNKPS